MKRFGIVVLTLCIAMMCTTLFEAQGQIRRTGAGNTGTTTRKEQNTQVTKSAPSNSNTGSRSTQTTKSAPAQQQQKAVKPSGNTGQARKNMPSNTQANKPSSTTRKQNQAPAQVQDRRNNGGATHNNSGSHSAQVSRKNSDVGRQNIPSNRDNKRTDMKPRDNKPQGHNPGSVRPPKERKPAAVQYHKSLPPKRGPEYIRPYLEPKHKPMPSYRYGDHYFGHRLMTLPRGYVKMRIGGIDYYYYDGIYYRPYLLGGYYVCRPPRGTTIASTLFNVALTAVAVNTIRNEIERVRRAATPTRAMWSARATTTTTRTS